MATINFKGDIAKADWFQSRYNTWITEVKKRKDILNMEPKHIKWLYQNDAIFKQFIDITRELNGYYEKVKDALQG